MVVAVVWYFVGNYYENAEAQNLNTGLDFLDQPAGFPIPSSDFRQSQPVRDALVEGLLNTLRLSITGIVLATVLGTLIGVARLSQNFVLRSAARVYVEIVRNVPLLAIVVLAYVAIVLNAFPPPNESWELGPIAVLNVRGASVFWYEGSNGKALVAARSGADHRCGRSPAGAATSPTRRASGPHGLVGDPGRAPSCWSWPGSCSGLGATAPELDGRRVAGGITMSPAYFAALLALIVVHGEPHRRDRAGVDPGRPEGAGRGGRRARPVGLPAAVVRRAPPGDADRRARRPATSTST